MKSIFLIKVIQIDCIWKKSDFYIISHFPEDFFVIRYGGMVSKLCPYENLDKSTENGLKNFYDISFYGPTKAHWQSDYITVLSYVKCNRFPGLSKK